MRDDVVRDSALWEISAKRRAELRKRRPSLRSDSLVYRVIVHNDKSLSDFYILSALGMRKSGGKCAVEHDSSEPTAPEHQSRSEGVQQSVLLYRTLAFEHGRRQGDTLKYINPGTVNSALLYRNLNLTHIPSVLS